MPFRLQSHRLTSRKVLINSTQLLYHVPGLKQQLERFVRFKLFSQIIDGLTMFVTFDKAKYALEIFHENKIAFGEITRVKPCIEHAPKVTINQFILRAS